MHRLILTSAATLLTFLALPPPAWASWVWPLQGEVITPYRNGDDAYAAGQHRGVDIAGDLGTPVVAAAGGSVRFAGTAGSSGLTVGVRTADGRFDTSYLHLSAASVREGDQVAAGDLIGTVGTTGTRSAERPHLHFGVRDAGSRHAYHDPLTLLGPPPPPGSPREAPAPGPAPVPLVPAPEPGRVPANGRSPAPRPAPVRTPRRIPARPQVPARPRVPSVRRVPVRPVAPARPRVPAARPTPAPGARPLPRGAPDPGPAPDGLRAPERLDAKARGHAAMRGTAAAGAADAPPASGGTRDPGRAAPGGAQAQPSAPARGGPDLGWVLACIGLLLAAAVLGLSEDGRKATGRSGRRLAGFLRPLVGRR